MAESEKLTLKERFERDGFLHIKGFKSPEYCERLVQRMHKIVDTWNPEETLAPVFATDTDTQMKAQGNSDYFLDSSDAVHFFLEKDAADQDGKLKPGIEKVRSLNKVGHALHELDPEFREYSHCSEVKELVAELGWIDPVLPQSMYIFKQPGIGGEVTSHQDSSFLFTTPKQTCLGLWLSLHNATLQNGCLWARPGSHKEPLRRQFVRNPAHFEDGNKDAPKLTFNNMVDSAVESEVQTAAMEASKRAMEWEGKLPEGWEPPSTGLKSKGFIPVICEPGDLVVIHGQVDHMSLANLSDKPRETYQLHLVEGPAQGITWHKQNWLQYSSGKPFVSLKPSAADNATVDKKRKVTEAGLDA